jgi:hypothetical protein
VALQAARRRKLGDARGRAAQQRGREEHAALEQRFHALQECEGQRVAQAAALHQATQRRVKLLQQLHLARAQPTQAAADAAAAA